MNPRERMNGKDHPNPSMQNAPGEDIGIKLQTVQAAHGILHTLIANPNYTVVSPEDKQVVIALAFDLAEAFDKKAQEYLKPPTIHAPPSNLVLK